MQNKGILPRNQKSVENKRYYMKRTKTPYTDQVEGIKRMYNCGLDFVRKVQEIDEEQGLVVYVGQEENIKLANCILKYGNKKDQVLSYDTTFKISDLFVSFLTIKNTILKDSPIFPVCALIHERKYESVHKYFWKNFILKKLKFAQDIPITTDKETAIRNGIIKALKKHKRKNPVLNCSNHLLQNCKFRLNKLKKKVNESQKKAESNTIDEGDETSDEDDTSDKENETTDNEDKTSVKELKNSAIMNQIKELIRCKELEVLEEKYDCYRIEWPMEFQTYFSQQIINCIRSNITKSKDLKLTSITTNISESCHHAFKVYEF